jgi:uncharacterized membrane protein YdbT with pleckstrin-like domain
MAKKPKVTNNGQPRYFEDQYDDEEVLYVFRKHPIVMRKGLIFASFGLLVGPLFTLILTYTQEDNPPTMTFFYLSFVFSIALSALIMFPYWMGWHFSVYILTSQRFIQISQKGFFDRKVADVPLKLVQSINYEVKGVEQTLLGFGTIIMQTFIGDTKLHYIHHPAKVQRTIVEFMRKEGISPEFNASNSRLKEHADKETQNQFTEG